MSTAFNYKYFLSILLLLNFGLNAKSASAKRAERNQRTLNTITRTVKQINQQYHEPLTILHLNNQTLLANALVTQAKQNYWFFRFARSSNSMQKQIAKLKYFSKKNIFNKQDQAIQALLIQVNQTIDNLEQLSNCLQKTPEYAKEINRYIKLRHFGLFIATPFLAMTAIGFFILSWTYILIALLAPSFMNPSHFVAIGLVWFAGGVISVYGAAKCQKVRKKDHYLESKIV